MQKERSSRAVWVGWVWLVVLCHLGRVTGAEAAIASPAGDLVLVFGASGGEDYTARFQAQARAWRRAAEAGMLRLHTIGESEESSADDRDVLEESLRRLANDEGGLLWVVLVGHGTFDGEAARFNLRGPDLSGSELATWLDGIERPMVLVNAFASSAPFMKAVAGRGRVVITSTRSGYEQSYSRFGEFFPLAFLATEADMDRDGQVSVLEAFLFAGNRVEEWYRTEGRLSTEHALLDDTGDGLGVGADWFRGLRVVRKARGGAGVDGRRARQLHMVPSEQERTLPPEVRGRRDELELEMYGLAERRGEVGEEAYYQQLEALLLQLAHLYEGLE